MKKKFEEYLGEKRQHMDVEQPDEKRIWDGISKGMNGYGRKPAFNYWKVAAVFLILLISGYFTWKNYFYNNSEKVIVRLAESSDEFAVQQAAYLDAITQKWNRINNHDFDLADYPWIERELNLLDEIQQDYFKDLETMGERPEIVRALLRYYENKLRILDQFINDLERTKNNQNRRLNNEYNI